MSMTKTGIIGLVVLIVILIGGYSIITQTGDGGTLGEMATTTDEGTQATTSDEVGTETDIQEESPSKDGDDMTVASEGAVEETNVDQSTDAADENDESKVAGTETGNSYEGGVGGIGDVSVSEVSRIAVKEFESEDLDVAFSYPKTWSADIDESNDEDGSSESVTVGDDFAGGMKAEMTVTVHEGAEISLEDVNEDDEIVLGKHYEVELECKDDDLDCAGRAFIIPVEGEVTEDGFEGTVVEVNYGVFEMPDYEGPDVGVDVDELFDVSESVFTGVVNSLDVSGVSGS